MKEVPVLIKEMLDSLELLVTLHMFLIQYWIASIYHLVFTTNY